MIHYTLRIVDGWSNEYVHILHRTASRRVTLTHSMHPEAGQTQATYAAFKTHAPAPSHYRRISFAKAKPRIHKYRNQ